MLNATHLQPEQLLPHGGYESYLKPTLHPWQARPHRRPTYQRGHGPSHLPSAPKQAAGSQ